MIEFRVLKLGFMILFHLNADEQCEDQRLHASF
jgi:hypothetical protein